MLANCRDDAPALAHDAQRGLKSSQPNERIGPSVVAVSALHPLVSLLRLDTQSCNWSGFEAADSDRFVGLLAIAVGAVIDPVKRLSVVSLTNTALEGMMGRYIRDLRDAIYADLG